MEALLFMLDSIVIVVMVYMGLRDDRRPPSAPSTSLFRFRDQPAELMGRARPAQAVHRPIGWDGR